MGKHGMVTIGDGTRVAGDIWFIADAPIIVGSGCLFSGAACLIAHEPRKVIGESPVLTGIHVVSGITIGDNCFIGHGAKILKGVTLGSDCVVGAGAIVTKSFPAGSVIGGVPARPLK